MPLPKPLVVLACVMLGAGCGRFSYENHESERFAASGLDDAAVVSSGDDDAGVPPGPMQASQPESSSTRDAGDPRADAAGGASASDPEESAEAGGSAGSGGDGGQANPELDARPSAAEISITNGAVPTAIRGSLTSGTEYIDLCPGNEVAIGYRGFASGGKAWLQSLRMMCGHAHVVWTGSSFQVSVTVGTTLDERGDGTGTEWVRSCPVNHVVVGFEGRSSGYVDQLSIRCALLEVSSDGSSLSLGSIATLPPAGGNNGTAFTALDCPTGQIAHGSYIRADSFPRAFGLYCGTPTLQSE